MCYIGCSAVSVSQEFVIAVDAPAPRKKSLKIKRVFAKAVEAFKLRSKKAKGKPKVSDFNVASFSSIVSAPLEDAPVAAAVKVQHEEPSCAPTLVAGSIEEESVNVCEETKDVVTSPGTIATPVLLYPTAAKISRSVKTPSLIPVRKTVVHAKGELEVKGASVVGSNVFKVKKASNVGTVINPKEKKTDISAVVPVAVRTSINVSKHTSIPIPAKAIPNQSRNTCRVRVRARGPGYVRKAKAGTVGDKREPLKIRSNIPVPTRYTKVGSLGEKENKQGGKERPKEVESYTITKETMNGPLEAIPTDISKQLREKADEEVINNDSLTVASLEAQDIISVISSTAHGIPDTMQQITGLKNDSVIPTTISGLPSIPSLPSINNFICMYTSSSLRGEHIMNIKITISALPTIDSLYECETKPSTTQTQLRPENDSAFMNAERTKNVQDLDNASVLAEIPPEASQQIGESTLHNSNSVACETVHHNVAPISISSEIRAHPTTYPITLTATHDLYGTNAESDPHRIVEYIDLVHPTIPQPPTVLSTIAAASQCAGTQARLFMTVDVMNKDQVPQFLVPTVSPSTESLHDDRSTPYPTNRNDEDSGLLSTIDQCVQNMHHAIETPARSASQALVQMDDRENGSPLCLHGNVEFLEKERQAQTYVCNVSPTAADLAPAAPTSNLPTSTCCAATSTQARNDANNEELAIQLVHDLARQAQARALTMKNKLDAMGAEERERRIAALTTRHEPNSSASPAKGRLIQLRPCDSSSTSATMTAPPSASLIPILKHVPASGVGLIQSDKNTTASEVSRAKQRYLDYRARKLYERQIGSMERKANSAATILKDVSNCNARGQIYRPPLRPVTSSTLNLMEQTKKSAVDPSQSKTVAHRMRCGTA